MSISSVTVWMFKVDDDYTMPVVLATDFYSEMLTFGKSHGFLFYFFEGHGNTFKS